MNFFILLLSKLRKSVRTFLFCMACYVLKIKECSLVSFMSSSTDFNGKMFLLNTVSTELSITGVYDGTT